MRKLNILVGIVIVGLSLVPPACSSPVSTSSMPAKTPVPVNDTGTFPANQEAPDDILPAPGLEQAVPYRVIGEGSIVNDDPDRSAGLWFITSENASGFEERAQTAARAVFDLFYLYKRDFTSVLLVPGEGVRVNYAQANFAADGKGVAGMTGSAPAKPGYWKIWSSDDEFDEQELAVAGLWSAKEQDFPQKDPVSSLSYDEQALRQYIADKLNIPYAEVQMPRPDMREYKLAQSFVDWTVSTAPDILRGNPRTEVALNDLRGAGGFTDAEKVAISARANEVSPDIKNEFDLKYKTAEENSRDSRWMVYSSWRPYTQSSEYRQLLEFCRKEGQKIWPLLFRQLDAGNRNFAGGLILDSTLPEYVYYFEKNGRRNSAGPADVNRSLPAVPDAVAYFRELLTMFD
jgi:hypothetical protein